MEWIKGNLNDVPVSQVVFATDYPQAVRDDDEVADYVAAYRKLGKTAAAIDANANKLIEKLPQPKKAARVRRSD
jgi:hypothetical protein